MDALDLISGHSCPFCHLQPLMKTLFKNLAKKVINGTTSIHTTIAIVQSYWGSTRNTQVRSKWQSWNMRETREWAQWRIQFWPNGFANAPTVWIRTPRILLHRRTTSSIRQTVQPEFCSIVPHMYFINNTHYFRQTIVIQLYCLPVYQPLGMIETCWKVLLQVHTFVFWCM